MHVFLIAVGRLKQGPERELVTRYRERVASIGKGLGFSGCDIFEIPESRARRAPDRCAEEGVAILERVPPNAALAVYDERGRADLPSQALAQRIAAWRDAAHPALAVAIGGADGLDPGVRARAGLVLSFGAATLPHGLVRVLAMEQVYRSLTILAGHPYHRGEP